MEELQYRNAFKSGSYDSDTRPDFVTSGGQGTLAAETVLFMFLESSDPDSLPMLLSELQVALLQLLLLLDA